jgi:hypothetical protein
MPVRNLNPRGLSLRSSTSRQASQMVVCDFGVTLMMAWFGVQVAGYRLKGQQFLSQEFDFLWPLARTLESREAAPLKCEPQVVDEGEAMGLVLE